MSDTSPAAQFAQLLRDLRNPAIDVAVSEAALDAYISEQLRACEEQTWRDAADLVENAGDYGEGGWYESSLSSAAERLRDKADELSKPDEQPGDQLGEQGS